jgi:hypothetical protein
MGSSRGAPPTPVRFLQQTLAGRVDEAATIRNATPEVWIQTEDRGSDADLAILRCASDLDSFRAGGARVVTGDLGMQLRAEHMGLQPRCLPDNYRKKRTRTERCRGCATPPRGFTRQERSSRARQVDRG